MRSLYLWDIDMIESSKKERYRNLLCIIIPFLLIILAFGMAIKNFNERKNYYKSIYGDYQIIINNISLETAEKVLNEDAMDGEIFIQLLSQKGNTINRMIWTSKNFLILAKINYWQVRLFSIPFYPEIFKKHLKFSSKSAIIRIQRVAFLRKSGCRLPHAFL